MQFKFLIIAAGAIILALLTYQVLSGLGKFEFNSKRHKIVGIAILSLAIIHATVGLVFLLR